MTFSWEMAEELAAAHMRELGFSDARRTPAGADHGIDVFAAGAVAQVKFYSKPVGSPDVQRLRGAAHLVPLALFYSSSGFTHAAIKTADELGVALFQFDERNVVLALNHAAERLTILHEELAAQDPETGLTVEEEALLDDIRVLRFKVRAWRNVCARGRAKLWVHTEGSPPPRDLLLPEVLDRVPAEEVPGFALSARAEAIDIGGGLLDLKHVVRRGEFLRNNPLSPAEQAAYARTFPDATSMPMPASIADSQERYRGLTARFVALRAGLLESTSQSGELERRALAEAQDARTADLREWGDLTPALVLT